MDPIRAMWDSLMQTHPNMMGIVGNAKLVGGRFDYNGEHEKVFLFLTNKGSYSFNTVTGEFKASKLQLV